MSNTDYANCEARKHNARRIKLDNGGTAESEQADWSNLINLEYDFSCPAGPTEYAHATTEEVSNSIFDESILSQSNDASASTEELLESSMFNFPSLEEWWAELPSEVQSGNWVTLSDPADTATLSGNTPESDSNYSNFTDERSTSLEQEGQDGKRRYRMQHEARRLLTDCFERHREDPYVPKEEIQKLATETGLSIRQVQVFFANARARKLPHPADESNGMNIPTLSRQQAPMERFLSSSPEDEGISEDAVREAASVLDRPIKPARSRKGRTPSVRSGSQSSTSNSSAASMDSLDSRGSRKGRKRQREPSKNVAKSIFRKPSSPSRKYQCTFCTLDFEQKYDWKRHEESVHFPQTEWVCMPNGPVENSKCVFCGLDNVDVEHLQSHKSVGCSESALKLRTFQRKDKLVQHIKQVHSCQPPTMLKKWCRPIERNVLLLCGFCGLALSNWKARADHISSHFNDGIVMTFWLPELIGGIWPDDHLTRNFVQDRFSATEEPGGHITCEACPTRFRNLRHATLHRRQAHNVYLPTDSKIVLSRSTPGHHSQRLINIAQQTSRIQVARTNDASEDGVPQNSALPHTRLVSQLAFREDVDPEFLPATTARPILNQHLNSPEPRGFSTAPHAAWQSVLNRNIVAGPRGSMPLRRPTPNPLMQLPARNATSTRRPLRSSNLGHAGNQKEAGPPVEAVRDILTRDREGVGHGSGDGPVQGMLHSLEQFGDSRRVWPRPPGL